MTRRSLLTLLFIGILLTSCGPSNTGEPTPDINGTIAANAQTMVAALFQTQTALAPAATNTALPTVTSLPTSTALTTLLATPTVQPLVYIVPTATPTGPTTTPLASSLAVGCKNLGLINSWTDPEGPFLAGQSQTFTQYWKVANNGTCDWLYGFDIEFVSGDKLGDGGAIQLSKKYEPGKWTTFSVLLHTPNDKGTYKASWRMTDGAGKAFGAVLPVSITVGGPTKTPQPTSTNTSMPPTATNTSVPTATNTTVPPTATSTSTPTPTP